MAAKTKAKLEIRIKNSTFIGDDSERGMAHGLPGYRLGEL
jgi:hypothetical protein